MVHKHKTYHLYWLHLLADDQKVFSSSTFPWIVTKAGELIYNQWPTRGSLMSRITALKASSVKLPSHLIALRIHSKLSLPSPCFRCVCVPPCDTSVGINFAEVTEDQLEVIGHLRLVSCQDRSDGCIVHSLVISPYYRRQGIGKHMMLAAEQYIRESGGGFVYLSTHDQQSFYSACGYSPCDPITKRVSCCANLSSDSVSDIELLLSRRDLAVVNDDTNCNQLLWMRRRIGELSKCLNINEKDFHRDIVIGISSNICDIVGDAMLGMEAISDTLLGIFGNGASNLLQHLEHCSSCTSFPLNPFSLSYKIMLPKILPWGKQVGPMCGLAALTMIQEALQPSTINLPSFLNIAIQLGETHDGEMFSTEGLYRVACVGGLPSPSLVSTKSLTPSTVVSLVSKGTMIVIAYDRVAGSGQPVFRRGHGAHWGVIVAVIIPTAVTSPTIVQSFIAKVLKRGKNDNVVMSSASQLPMNVEFNLQCEFIHSRDEHSSFDDVPNDVLIVIQHSMSKKPIVAKLSLLIASNAQLCSVRPCVEASNWILKQNQMTLADYAVEINS